jgi:RNA polymerase sigma-70 factor (ECF subfamily)
MPADSVKGYQPYWAVRAHLAQQLGRVRDALDAFDRAIALTEDDGTRQFLHRRREHAVHCAAPE